MVVFLCGMVCALVQGKGTLGDFGPAASAGGVYPGATQLHLDYTEYSESSCCRRMSDWTPGGCLTLKSQGFERVRRGSLDLP